MLYEMLSGLISTDSLYIAIITLIIFIVIIKIVNATLKEVIKFVVSVGILAAVVWVVFKILI